MAITTIEQFINSKPDIEISYEFLSLYEKINNKGFITYNVINDYYNDIKEKALTILLSDELYYKYKFNPERLCREIYGSADLSFIILAINGMASPTEFVKKKIKLLRKSEFETLITEIINAEKQTKLVNNEKIK